MVAVPSAPGAKVLTGLVGNELVPIIGVGPLSQVVPVSAIAALSASFGTNWYVDTVNGDDDNDGLTPGTPFATMGRAFYTDTITAGAGTTPNLSANDRIYFVGVVRQQLIAPLLGADGAALTGVAIIGDAQGGVRDDDGAKWTYPASGATAAMALLACRQQGWSVSNFLMTPEPNGGGGAAIKLNRAEDAVNPDASHFIASGMRFVGIDVTTTYGIQDVGGCSAVSIYNCQFYLLTTGIYSSSQAIAVPLRWKVVGNQFLQNTNDIIVPSSYGIFQGNRHMSSAATQVVNIASGGFCTVTGNIFPDVAADIDPAHGYDGNATDLWTGNLVPDQAAFVFGDPA